MSLVFLAVEALKKSRTTYDFKFPKVAHEDVRFPNARKKTEALLYMNTEYLNILRHKQSYIPEQQFQCYQQLSFFWRLKLPLPQKTNTKTKTTGHNESHPA